MQCFKKEAPYIPMSEDRGFTARFDNQGEAAHFSLLLFGTELW